MLALLLACAGSQKPNPESASTPEPSEPAEEPSPEPERVVAMPSGSRAAPSPDYGPRATDFGMRFHQQLADGNSATSGVSAQIALSMVAAGAAGDTLGEFNTLFGGDVGETWHIDNARGMAAYNDTMGVELTVVNGLWTQTGLTLLEPYTKNLQDNYLVQPSQLDFGDASGAADTINGWTKEHTDGRIEKLVEPGDVAGAKLVLANAVAFKGKWATPFDAENTKDRAFQAASGEVQVPMMYGELEGLSYVEEDTFKAIALPYEKRATQMILILPNDGVDIAKVEERMDVRQLNRMTMSGRRPVNVTMPKWKAELTHDLAEPLKAMGLETAFGGGDFSAMSDTELTIDAAIQKVFVQVDEEGTEAAAVTGVIMKTTSIPPPPVDFVLDRPFFWAIWHTETQTPLFTGRVEDPSG